MLYRASLTTVLVVIPLVLPALPASATLQPGPQPAAGKVQILECDRLAAHPSDPDKVGPGVARAQMDLGRAIAACRADLAAHPGDARLQYQLGRVLFYAGRTEEALPHLEAAARGGHRQGQFVYGYIFVEGQNGLPREVCRAESPWRRAAEAGHQAARISYARLWLRGAFDRCPSGQASRETVEQFLLAAQKAVADYYQGLLVTDLLDELRRR